jgi:hypothetical protein
VSERSNDVLSGDIVDERIWTLDFEWVWERVGKSQVWTRS